MSSRNHGIGICPECNIEFKKGNSVHTFCTKKCLDKNTRRKNRTWISEYKIQKGCEICRYNKHPVALHFDHKVPSEKEFNISLDMKRKKEDIEKEIKKCRVLCANCHAVETQRKDHYTMDMSKRGFINGNTDFNRQTKRKSK